MTVATTVETTTETTVETEKAANKTAMGNNMREVRESLGMSQGDLAHITHISEKSISRYEVGTVEPGALTLFTIADAMGASMDVFSPKPIHTDGIISANTIIDKFKMLSAKKQLIIIPAISSIITLVEKIDL